MAKRAIDILLFVAVVLAAARWAAGAEKEALVANAETITGCLSGPTVEGIYLLKNEHYPKGVEVGRSTDLGIHPGHQVKLTGTWATSRAEIGEHSVAKAPERGRDWHFKVLKIDMISETCAGK